MYPGKNDMPTAEAVDKILEIKDKQLQAKLLRERLEESIAIRKLTSLEFKEDEALYAGFAKPSGTRECVFRIRNEAGETEVIQANKLPWCLQRKLRFYQPGQYELLRLKHEKRKENKNVCR